MKDNTAWRVFLPFITLDSRIVDKAGVTETVFTKWMIIIILNAFLLHLLTFSMDKKLIHCREILKKAGADFVIDSLNELPPIIEKINNK